MPPYVSRTAMLRAHLKMPLVQHAYRTIRTLPCFTLEGKNCIVTGASQGLGKEILTAFARSGAHGGAVDLSIGSAKQSVSEINTELKESGLPPANLKGYECDTSSEEGVKSTWQQILKDFQRIDVVVTNAGIIGESPAEEYPFDDWRRLLEVNVNGTFLFAREAGKHMLEKEIKGTIIMISSMSGLVVNRPQKQSAYNVSKAATTQMMKSFATEWAPHGIRVNSLSPGYIQTPKNEGEEMKKRSKEWIQHIPLGRVAKPDEFRGTVVWMASDASSYMTGADIVVDGGYTAW